MKAQATQEEIRRSATTSNKWAFPRPAAAGRNALPSASRGTPVKSTGGNFEDLSA